MEIYKDICIIIPSLNPDDKIIRLISELSAEGFENIIIVNDGSDEKHELLFNIAREKYKCQILKHYVNMGKGRALKNAFNYVLNCYPQLKGVITADSDGQHLLKDIKKCAQLIIENPREKKMFLGSRDFNAEGIPSRSRFGNKITSKVLNIFCDIKISDTQTGLRGLTREALEEMLILNGERYEYEMNMIIESREKNIAIDEFPIETIYIEDNASSHFNPLVDSYKIYKQFFKYIIACEEKIKPPGFRKHNSVEAYIIISTYGARLVSSVYNYSINKKVVFNNDDSVITTAIKYFVLCVIQGTLSGILVNYLFSLTQIAEIICKMIVDTLLFFVSFFVQKKLVFKGGNK